MSRELPRYEAYEFELRQHDYCVAIFVINEGQRLHRQLDRMQLLAGHVDIVVADGGSKDGSVDKELLKERRVNTLLVKTGAGKLGAQMRMAFAWALDRGYKGVVVIDGNNKDSVDDIPHFVSKLQEGFDHIQGSRFVVGGHHENTPLSRLLGVKLLHAPLISLSSGFSYSDTTNGFRAYSARLLLDSRVKVFRHVFEGYELHYYLAIRAARLNFRCTEIPVTRVYPSSGPTPTKISSFSGNLSVLAKLFSVCTGRYNP